VILLSETVEARQIGPRGFTESLRVEERTFASPAQRAFLSATGSLNHGALTGHTNGFQLNALHIEK
jgi:hypothetical protein